MKIRQFKNTGVDRKKGIRGDGKKVNVDGGARFETSLYGSSEKVPILEITEKVKDREVSGVFFIFDSEDEFKDIRGKLRKLIK